jgi:peptidylprolyl isomerase domain and WD repeat-containing protein 1
MSNMFRLDYIPTRACWCHKRGSPFGRIAIATKDSNDIHVYSTDSTGMVSSNANGDEEEEESSASVTQGAGADQKSGFNSITKGATGSGGPHPLKTITLHRAPVVIMALHEASGTVISGDEKGMLEYWPSEVVNNDPKSTSLPKNSVSFRFKVETDLIELAKTSTRPCGIAMSPDGSRFALTASDKQVRVFDFAKGKMIRKYDESLATYEDANARSKLRGVDNIDFGQRSARERELENDEGSTGIYSANPVFDKSGHFLCYTTLAGIKIVNVETNKVKRTIGLVENQVRFLSLALYQGTPKIDSQFTHSRMGDKPKTKEEMNKDANVSDPLFLTTGFKKERFYMFSTREPKLENDGDGGALDVGRDVFNEKPTAEQMIMESAQSTILGKDAILRTSMGDIHIKLFGTECPKTVENFTVHARNGYYDGTIVHRVIKSFMIRKCTLPFLCESHNYTSAMQFNAHHPYFLPKDANPPPICLIKICFCCFCCFAFFLF